TCFATSYNQVGFGVARRLRRRPSCGPTQFCEGEEHMAQSGKHSGEGSEPASISGQLSRASEQSQLDFELEFYGGILERQPDYVDVLRVMGNNLTLKGRYAQGLQIDTPLVTPRPADPLAHYPFASRSAFRT